MVTTYLDGHVLSWSAWRGAPKLLLNSHAVKQQGTIVWIDPLDTGAELESVLAWGKPEHLIMTCAFHDRDTIKLAKRFQAQIWVPEGGTLFVKNPDHRYKDGDPLPGGLAALRIEGMGMGESVLHGEIAGRKVAFMGDSVAHGSLADLPLFPFRLFKMLRQVKGDFMHRNLMMSNRAEAFRHLAHINQLALDAAFFGHGPAIEQDAAAQLKESIASWS